jgi:threonine dehydrogenase-like Zn-dependent dehydrogenase
VKSLVFTGSGNLRIEDRPSPEVSVHEVLCRVLASGVCGSELEAYQGFSTSRTPPLVLGHELVVSIVGQESSGTYIVNPLQACGICSACLGDRSYACPARTLLSLHRDGGNAEYISVPVDNLIPWRSDDLLKGVLVEPGATAFHALEAAESLRDGANIVVVGCGSIGLLTVVLARMLGFRNVFAFDPVPERMALATRLGAQELDLKHPPAGELVVDTVGSAASRETALAAAAVGGEIRLVGLRHATTDLPFSSVIGRSLRLSGVYAYNRSHLERAAQLLASSGLVGSDLVAAFPLTRGQEAFDLLVRSPEQYLKIALMPEMSSTEGQA